MKVFFFRDPIHANHFELLLNEEKVEFEKQIDEEGDQTIYFGVKSSDFKRVQKLNYLTLGKFRKPFIPDRFFRFLLIAVSLLVLGLAFAGALLSE
ncbi:MAG: hypothetical protein RIC95_15680 [Vicingaceae bacterium]